MKTVRASDATALASLAVTSIFTAILYSGLPERMATHFDLHGRPNDWTDVRFGAWLVPAIALATWAVVRFAEVFTKDEPKRRAIREAPTSLLAMVLVLFLCAVQLLLLAYARGLPVDMNAAVCALLGILSVILGLVLPRTKPNPVVGIRTAWTLRSPENWARVHKAAGPLFVLSGVVGIVCAAVGGPAAVPTMVAALLVPSLGLTVYSYVLKRRGV
jgi:uncharacterized membrane protein